MKVKAPSLLKRIMAALSSKTNELRTRIMIFFLLRNKAMLIDSLSDKLRALIGGGRRHRQHHKKAMVMHAAAANKFISSEETAEAVVLDAASNDFDRVGGEVAEEAMYPNLVHILFKESKEEMELSREEEEGNSCLRAENCESSSSYEGEDIRLEDIDHAAQLFIERFRRQMRLQNQGSFDEDQQMMQHSV